MFIFGQVLLIVNGILAVIEHRDTDVAIYILAVWTLFGLSRVVRAIEERR